MLQQPLLDIGEERAHVGDRTERSDGGLQVGLHGWLKGSVERNRVLSVVMCMNLESRPAKSTARAVRRTTIPAGNGARLCRGGCGYSCKGGRVVVAAPDVT